MVALKPFFAVGHTAQYMGVFAFVAAGGFARHGRESFPDLGLGLQSGDVLALTRTAKPVAVAPCLPAPGKRELSQVR